MDDGMKVAVVTLAGMGLVLSLVAFFALRNFLAEVMDSLGCCLPEEGEDEMAARAAVYEWQQMRAAEAAEIQGG
jgi:hypothetical protein